MNLSFGRNRILSVFLKIISAIVLLMVFFMGDVYANINDGLVANWTFDSCTAIDDTINTNNGQIIGNPKCVNGIKSKALKFDGVYSPDYVVVSNSPDIAFNNNFTFSLWFNVGGNISMDGWGRTNEYGRQVLLAKSGDREGLEIGLGRGTDGLWYPNLSNGRCCSTDGRSINAPLGFGVILNTWHLVSVTMGNGMVRFYVDGKLAGEQTASEFNINPGTAYRNLQLSIGQSSYWYPFNGSMDDVRVYNRSLSNGEVTSLYEEVFPSIPPFSLLSSTPNSTSTLVPTNTIITLNFSKPLNQATVPGNIILERTGLATLGSMSVVTSSESTIVLRPSVILDKNASYTVRLRTGLKDINGEGMGSEITLSFTTGSEPAQPGTSGIISSTSLSPTCILGYSVLHPECSLLNQSVINTNNQVVYSNPASTSTVGDPVSLPTGEFTYSNTLMHANGNGIGYDFALSYKSQAYSNGPIGINWDHSYNIFLRENIDGSVTYFDGKFGVYTFVKDTDGKFGRLPGIEADLVKTDTNYELRFTNGTTDIFNADLRIASIRDKDNHTLTFTYTIDKLTSTTDTLGRTVTYEYYDHSRLKSITDFSGRTVTLAYYNETDEGGSAYDLKSITINNGDVPKTISFTYQKDPVSEILSHNILTLTDSSGKEYVKNIYDGDDRVISQKYGDGTLYYSYETVGGNGADKNHITKTTAINKRGMKSEFSYDASGNILTKKLFEGDTAVTTIYTYAPNGKIATEMKPLGNGVSYQYDAQGRTIEKRLKADMTQPDDTVNDIVTKFEYGTSFNVPTKIVDSNGNTITTALDTKGNITETKILGVKKADRSTYDMTNIFTYDSNGHLVTKADGIGNTTKYEYENGRLIKVTEGNGDETIITLFSYDTHGNLLTTTDGEGNIKKFAYDQYDRLVTSLSSEGILQETSYDANNNKTEQRVNLENGKILSSTSVYDILDQVIGNTIGTDSLKERTTSIVRDANGNITEMNDVRGLKTKYVYDIFDRPIEKRLVIPSGDIVTKYEYDRNGNIVKTIDARNTVTNYTYDRFDRMITSTDVLGTRTSLTYDKSGNINTIETKDSSGKTLSKTERVVDSLGHVIRETQGVIDGASGIITTVDYDQNGKPVKVTDAKGNITTVTYDSLGRKKMVTDALGNQTILTYDRRGLTTKQEVKSTDGKSIVTLLNYDKDGRLVSKTDSLGNKTASIYNKLGQVTQTTDAKGNVTDYTYDVFGNTLSETKYSNGKEIKTSYEYDKSNNRTKLTDANGNITTYTYNGVNRLIKETLADGSFVTYEYDTVGNIIQKTDANGTIVNNIYDQLNRLTKRTIAWGTNVLGVTEENYEYDSLGRLVKSTDSEGNILSFIYDSFGRLTSETQNGKTVQTGYDANSNITSLTYSSGKKVVRDYDVLNRLTGISLDGKSIASYGQNSLTLDALTLGNGAKTTYGYDSLLRLKELTNIGIETVGNGKKQTTQESIINKLSFSYDATSNILGNGHDTYSYDSLNRLTQAGYEATQDKKSIAESFIYDPIGNRLTSLATQIKEQEKNKKDDKIKTDTTNYMSNILNQYTSVDKTKLIYDKNGNLVNNGIFQFSYDYRNRLVEVKKIGEKGYENEEKDKKEQFMAKFSYDVLGRRVSKEAKEQITKYTYSNQNTIEESEYKKDDGKMELTETRENIYGQSIDDIIATLQTKYEDHGKKKKSETYFYQKNQLGSITAITDDKGKVVEEYRYNAFGKTYIRDGKSDNWREFKESRIGNVRLFTGREYDEEIGLYYYRARYYSADLGRFISRDPIGTADNINLYTYVGNSPVGFVDPMGREKAILTIYSNRGNGYVIGGHSWVEIVKNGITIKYGLWPDGKVLNGGVQINGPESTYDSHQYENVSSASMNLSTNQLKEVRSFINIQINSGLDWWTISPCSDFASDVWNLVGYQLEDRNIFGISNPGTLADSIDDWNKLFNF